MPKLYLYPVDDTAQKDWANQIDATENHTQVDDPVGSMDSWDTYIGLDIPDPNTGTKDDLYEITDTSQTGTILSVLVHGWFFANTTGLIGFAYQKSGGNLLHTDYTYLETNAEAELTHLVKELTGVTTFADLADFKFGPSVQFGDLTTDSMYSSSCYLEIVYENPVVCQPLKGLL